MNGRSDPLPVSDLCSPRQLTDETITGYTTQGGRDKRMWREERQQMLAKPTTELPQSHGA